jgi:1,4-dihydroxy-2-naphthoyl-CoA hydrolase
MAIWFGNYTVEELNTRSSGTMAEAIDIRFTEIGDDYLQGTMPVDHRTVQPERILHGGASVALAETLGSVAATLCVDPARYFCAGIEINANHLRSVRKGSVTGIARPIHLGRSTHVWETRITDEADRLVCVSRITLAVLERQNS